MSEPEAPRATRTETLKGSFWSRAQLPKTTTAMCIFYDVSKRWETDSQPSNVSFVKGRATEEPLGIVQQKPPRSSKNSV